MLARVLLLLQRRPLSFRPFCIGVGLKCVIVAVHDRQHSRMAEEKSPKWKRFVIIQYSSREERCQLCRQEKPT